MSYNVGIALTTYTLIVQNEELSASVSTSFPATSSISLTGDATGGGLTAIPVTLATVNPNPGTWGLADKVARIVVNAKGLITSASHIAIAIAATAVSMAGGGLLSEYFGFATRDAFVTWTVGKTPAVGTVIWAGGYSYIYDGVSAAPLLPAGWLPAGDWTVVHFGAKGNINASYTTGPDDGPAFMAAATAKSAAGGGPVYVPEPAYGIGYRTMLGPQIKNGVTFVTPNPDTKIICTADGAGNRWPIYGCIVGGGFISDNYQYTSAYSIANVAVGDPTILMNTPAEAAYFAKGDVVQTESTATYTIGTIVHPTWHQMNVVTDIVGAVITLRRPIDTTYASVQLRQLTTTQVMKNGDGTTATGYVLSAVRDGGVLGGSWINTKAAAPFNGAGGMIDCVIRPHLTQAATGTAYGNAYAHCNIGEDVHIGRKAGCEFGFGSHNNTVTITSMSHVEMGLLPLRSVQCGEGSRHNNIRIGTLDIGNMIFGAAAPIINLANSYDNGIEIGSIIGKGITGAVVQFQTAAFPGVNNDCCNNRVKIWRSKLGTQLRYVQISVGAYDNTVEGNFYGPVTNDALSVSGSPNVIKGYMEQGVANGLGTGIVGTVLGVRFGQAGSIFGGGYNAFLPQHVMTKENVSAASLALQQVGYLQAGATYTSVAPFTRTFTIPAGTLLADDMMKFKLFADLNGSVATKSVVITLNGSTVYSNTAIPIGAQTLNLDLDLIAANNTTFLAKGSQVISSVLTTISNNITGLNFTTTAYDLVVTISLAGAGDTFSVRKHGLEAWDPRMTGRLI